MKAPATPEPEVEVVQTFERYRDALLARDGDAAAPLVTQETIVYYDEMRDLATTAGPAQIRAKALGDQVLITMLRVDPGVDRLRSMDGADVFAFAVDRGYVGGRDQVQGAAMGDVKVTADVATAPILDEAGNPTELVWEFVREEGAWKLDVAALIPTTNVVLEEQAARAGLSADQFVLRSAGAATGTRLTPDIWEAPSG